MLLNPIGGKEAAIFKQLLFVSGDHYIKVLTSRNRIRDTLGV
jgi:hypothetical protein